MTYELHTLSIFQKSSLESSKRSKEDKSGKSVSSSISVVKLALINSSKLILSSELIDNNEEGLSLLCLIRKGVSIPYCIVEAPVPFQCLLSLSLFLAQAKKTLFFNLDPILLSCTEFFAPITKNFTLFHQGYCH